MTTTKVDIRSKENIDSLMKELGSKSATIRYLASKNYKRADIARALNIRYQHVRNVLVAEEEKQQK